MKYSGFYFAMFRGTMKKVIAENYGSDFADDVMKKSKKVYRRIVEEMDDVGSGNPMAYNIQFALAFVAPYLASEKRISPEVMQDVMRQSLHHVKWFFSRTDLNTDKGKLENSKNIRRYVKWYTPEKEAMYPASFKVDFVGMPYEGACYYRITRCAICPYVKKLGAGELMPLFCELDNVMIGLQHGRLIREKTIADGDEFCDYYIVGDKEQVPGRE